jgi:hypothetical protein
VLEPAEAVTVSFIYNRCHANDNNVSTLRGCSDKGAPILEFQA